MTDVVIGAGSGMGAAVARRLAERGNPLLLADRDEAAAAAVAGDLDGDVSTMACDITDDEAVAALTERVGTIGALVVTAGISPTMADGRTVVAVDLIAMDAVVAAFQARCLAPGSVGVCFASSASYSIPADPEPVAETPPAEPAPGGVRTIDGPEAEAVDLLAVAGGTFAKYAIGAVVAIAVVVLVLVLLFT